LKRLKLSKEVFHPTKTKTNGRTTRRKYPYYGG
jgi:hypothetical protein